MHKKLFLLCPTDCLEPIINKSFKQDNYFYTSLGNSFSLDFKSLRYIEDLMQEHHIRDIYFIISEDNKIMLDALGKQSFAGIRGLREFYNTIEKQKEHSKVFSQTDNLQFIIISYYFNKKIKELQLDLQNFSDYPITIQGKIYNRKEKVFHDIHSNLICLEKQSLN